MDFKTIHSICLTIWKVGALLGGVYYIFKPNKKEGDLEKGWIWMGISIAIQI